MDSSKSVPISYETPKQIIINNCKRFLKLNKEQGLKNNEQFYFYQIGNESRAYNRYPLQERDLLIIFIYSLRIKTIYRGITGIDDINELINKLETIPVKNRLKRYFELKPKQKFELCNQPLQLLALDLFKGIQGIAWPNIDISKKCVLQVINQHGYFWQSQNKYNSHLAQFDAFIEKIISIMRGQFEPKNRLYLNKICFSEAFVDLNKEEDILDYTMTYAIVPRRLPIQEIVDGQRKLIGFRFTQKIELYDFKIKQKPKTAKLMLKFILSRPQFKDVDDNRDTFQCFLPDNVLFNIPKHKRLYVATEHLTAIVDQKTDPITNHVFYVPKRFETQILTEEFAKKYQFVKGRWYCPDEFQGIEDKFQNASSEIINAISDENGAQQLLNLIQSIPELKFKLTIEQQKMINTPDNLLCLGRSGTGKTTCSALRLFSTNVFYKYMEQLKEFNDKNKGGDQQVKFKVDPNFMDNKSKLKIVFVTTSPVLTFEVKRFYNEIKDHFTKMLNKKQQKIKDTESVQLFEKLEELKETSTKDNFVEEYVKQEVDALMDDDDFEKQINLPHSIEDLSSEHYPLFVSIKRLINMVDASLNNQFFARRADGSLIGMDSNIEWHNDSKGIFMINKYFKNQNHFNTQIKNLDKKMLLIDEQLEMGNIPAEYQGQNQMLDQNNQGEGGLYNMFFKHEHVKSNTVDKQLSFEVDFDIFSMKFWPKVCQKTKLSSLVVWTEIFSVIKGSGGSYYQNDFVLPETMYIDIGNSKKKNASSLSFLKNSEKVQIYYIFVQYEKWKYEMNAYDMMDVVNHILVQIEERGLNQSKMIHFLMVDEVQDLTPNILKLLSLMTEKNIFYCGDTAQTIAKGLGFRFFDLKNVFKNQETGQSPPVIQLSKNFRSHKQILGLANSVVSLIELIFPQTIDKLLKEQSELDGPKPIIINPAKDQFLRWLLLGRTLSNFDKQEVPMANQNNNSQEFLNKPQFGCNQVVIVRDQESKNKLPDVFENMLCLTVYEAKGLEFDDVILFNFFEDSICGSQWKLLKDVEFKIRKEERKDEEFQLINFNSLDMVETSSSTYDNTSEMITQYTLKRDRDEVYRAFAQLCTELKFLYVAITRPKNVLIIYDTDNKNRIPIQELWAKLGLVEIITKDMQKDPTLIKPQVANMFKRDLSTNQTSKEEWKQQGILLFKKKFYGSALSCFKNSQDKDLEIRCLAYQHADKAAALMAESQSYFTKSKMTVLKQSERNQHKKKAEKKKTQFMIEMSIAGQQFEKIEMKKHAAQCYCSSKNLDKAAQIFEEIKEYGQAAECYQQLSDIKKAAEMYEKGSLFMNAFECYEKLQDWEGLLMCLSKNKDSFKDDEKSSLIENYFPIALNSLYQLYNHLDPGAQNIGLSEENKGKFQEMRIKLKFQKSVRIIKEEDEEQIDNEDGIIIEQDEKEEELVDNLERNIENNFQIEVEKDQQTTFQDQNRQQLAEGEKSGYSIIQESQENSWTYQVTDQSQIVDQVKGDQQMDKLITNNQSYNSQNFELVQHIDLDDEFLQSSRSISIIESLVSNDDNCASILSDNRSQFSIIPHSLMHSAIMSIQSIDNESQGKSSNGFLNQSQSISSQPPGGSFLGFLNNSCISRIDQQRDLYAEDIIMQKLIYYISLFSDDVKKSLQEMRSKDKLSHLEFKESAQGLSTDKEEFIMFDLDQVSLEMLNLILDILEHYEMFMLCLIICTRYSLSDKIARYIVSIGSKYSNLKQFRYTALKKFELPQQANAQKIYSMVAHEAIHNVLTSIDSSFLAIEVDGGDKLGLKEKCFDNLFLQGFWKKLVFLMDVNSALELCFATQDHENFKLLQLVYKNDISKREDIKFLTNPLHYREFMKDISYHIQENKQIFSDIKHQGELMFQNKNKQNLNFGAIKRIISFQFSLVNLNSVIQQKYTHNVKAFIKQQSTDDLVSLLNNLQKLHRFIQNGSHNQNLDIHKINHELKRVAYSVFGVSYLKGLDLFNKFSDQYMLVRYDSSIIQHIKQKQEMALQNVKEDILQNIYQESKLLYVEENLRMKYTSQLFQKQLIEIDQNNYVQQAKLAYACDLDLELYMVPSEWIDENIAIQTVRMCEALISEIHSRNQTKFQDLIDQRTIINYVIKDSNKLASFIKKEHIQLQQKRNQRLTNDPNLLAQLNGPDPPNISEIQKMLESSLIQLEQKLKQYDSQIIETSKYLFRYKFYISESSLQNNITEQVNEKQQDIILASAFQHLNQCIENLHDKKKFYNNLLIAYRLFTSVDKYIYMLEIIKNQKKQIQKLLLVKTKAERLKLINSANVLLDSHVYLKCNAWQRSTESLLYFLKIGFDNIKFEDALEIVEQTYYRTLLCYFIVHNEKDVGVLIPDYAMVYIEPASNYKCHPLDDKNSTYEVLLVEYNDFQVEPQSDIVIIEKILKQVIVLIEQLQNDNKLYKSSRIYNRIYNMYVTTLLNMAREKGKHYKKLQESLTQVADSLNGRTQSNQQKNKIAFNKDMEMHRKTVQNVTENKLFSLLKQDAVQGQNIQNGFLRIICKQQPDSNIGQIIAAKLNTAYFQEQSELSKHTAAANYIKRIWSKYRIFRIQGQNQNTIYSTRGSESYSEILSMLQLKQKQMKEKIPKELLMDIKKTIDCIDTFSRFVDGLMNSNSLLSSLDIHYLKSKFELVTKIKHQYVTQIKDSCDNIQSYQILIDRLTQLNSTNTAWYNEELLALNEWQKQKTSPNIIQQEIKTNNNKMKWDKFVEFHKKKKLMLRHLKANSNTKGINIKQLK